MISSGSRKNLHSGRINSERAAGLPHLLKRSSTDRPYGAMPYSYCALHKLPRYVNRPTPQRAYCVGCNKRSALHRTTTVCLLRRYRYRIQASLGAISAAHCTLRLPLLPPSGAMRCAHGTLAGFIERRRLFQRRKAVQDRQLDQRGDVFQPQLLHQAAAVGIHRFR